MLIDSDLTFAAHVRRLTGRCFYQLRQLRTIRRTLTTEAAKTLVHAFVISRVDYYNSIFGLKERCTSASTSVSCQRGRSADRQETEI